MDKQKQLHLVATDLRFVSGLSEDSRLVRDTFEVIGTDGEVIATIYMAVGNETDPRNHIIWN